MELKLYNTLSRKKEEFVPIGKEVRMYSCGPTVYNYAHIGNLRTYVFMDLLRRILTYNGYRVKSVMNITDVGHLLSDADEGEDKMEKASREQKKTPYEIAAMYTEQFFKDIAALNIQRPTLTPRATENIAEMIEIVQELLKKGYAYEIDDGIYYSVDRFPEYGKLSGTKLEDNISGARVEVNTQKRNPADFALWKKADKNHIMQWESPWGMSYPGWHIECSAMSKKYLGMPFDIHTGGVDHIPIHHENEIAQGEALTGQKNVNYWMHSEFMLVDGGKMSKSLGNTYTVTQLKEKGYQPLDFRYLCLNTHYRQKLNFTFESLDGAKAAYERLCRHLLQHKAGTETVPQEVLSRYEQEFHEAINDDLNVPMAMGVLWKLLKEPKSKQVYDLAVRMDAVFGLNFAELQPEKEPAVSAPENVRALAEQRKAARAEKNWAESDRLRAEIAALGYAVKDTKDGYELSKNA